MTFWSSQKLNSELPSLITHFDPTQVKEASYTLMIGDEVFVTNDHRNSNALQTRTRLSPNQDFVIPPGQFAFLLTEEVVEVPAYAIAFISIKAKYKYKGLVNISGFHVDPGFKGKLLFTIYNAGPTPMHLNRGLRFFVIWFAGLDRTDNKPRAHQSSPENINIPIDVLNQISTEEIYSLQALTSEFRNIDSIVSKKIIEIDDAKQKAEKAVSIISWVWKGIIALVIVIIFPVFLFFGNSIISISKFAIEQHEFFTGFVEYKKELDQLIEHHKKATQNIEHKQKASKNKP